MTKIAIEDQDLAEQVREYLRTNGQEVADDTPISVQLPGAGKASQRCLSGSGLMTAGGRFVPGYDAKLKSALYHIIAGNPDKTPDELKENGPMYRPLAEWTPELAKQAIDDLGWPQPTLKPPKPPKEKKVKENEEAEGGTNSDGEPPKKRRAPTKADRAKLKEQAPATSSEENVEQEPAEAAF